MRGRKKLRDPLTGRFMSRSRRPVTKRNRRRRMRALPSGRVGSSVFEMTSNLVNVLTAGDNYTTDAKRYLVQLVMYFRRNVAKNENIYTLADDLDIAGPFRRFQSRYGTDNDVNTFIDETMNRDEATFILFIVYRIIKKIKDFVRRKELVKVSAPLVDDAVQEITEDVSDSDRREVIDNYFYELV